ncbi:MAG: glycosyltransferase family 1 protein [Moorea sp. SIO3C2]|nr:glycosyltransferase family 1 protein [Moorena sp. SIO3C2]
MGTSVVDYPKCEFMYKGYLEECQLFNEEQNALYGLGFTLYALLHDLPIDRTEITQKVHSRFFDLIIFSNIGRHFGIFVELLPYLTYKNTFIFDGMDSPNSYPYAGKWWRYPQWWFLPKAHTKFLYFKREWTPETISNLWFQLVPSSIAKLLPAPKNFRKISFSIPEEKIVENLPKKTKLFPKHIVDKEVASNIDGSLTAYAFDNEKDYYADLQASKFGITTKRSGWDCLRHYEIAANGCVPCFRDLDKKPSTCAPHGLNGSNCIIYHNYADLIKQINSISEQQYLELQLASLDWARKNTTIQRAKQLLEINT